MTQGTPPETPKRGLPPAAWFVIGAVVVLVAIGLPLLLLGGDDEPATTTGATTTTTGQATTSQPATTQATTTTAAATTSTAEATTTTPETTTTTAPEEVEAAVYFLADTEETNLPGPHLAAVARSVPVADPMTAVLESLLEGPADDDPPLSSLSTGVPEEVELLSVEMSDGVADVDLSANFAEGGGSFGMFARLAQVVFTATQFPEVDSVLFLLEGVPVEVFSGEGIVLDGPQTREDYYDHVVPLVFLDLPPAGASVASPVTLSGIANAFEATVSYEILAGDSVVAEGFTTATCGTGCWGDFSVEAEFEVSEETEGVVSVFENSAEDGRRINIQSYPVTLLPPE